MFDLRAGDCVHVLNDSKSYDPVQDIVFSNSGRLIFAGTKSSEIKFWDSLEPSGEVLGKIDVEVVSGINCVALSQDAGDVAFAGFDGSIGILSKNIQNVVAQDKGTKL